MPATHDRRPELSLSFHCFWPEFVAGGSSFVRALERRFRVRVETVGRDLQIYSVFGAPEFPTPAGTRPLRVWWTGEAAEPKQGIFDLHFGFLPRTLWGERWHRFPLWTMSVEHDAGPEHPRSVHRLLAPRPVERRAHFCNFVYSNPVSLRAELYLRLTARRRVESLGRLLATVPHRVEDKLAALADYRLTLAIESCLAPGYVTEKLVEPLLVGSVPIYWGADEAREDFNPRAFVFARDFATFDELIAHVLRLDDDHAALAAMAAEPAILGGKLRYEHTPAFFAERIADALERRLTAPLSEAEIERVRASRLTSGRPTRRHSRWTLLLRRMRGRNRR